jgi:hypothetical protein
MAKVTFIGAGSTVFAKNLMGDILSYPELSGSTIASPHPSVWPTLLPTSSARNR